MAKLTTTKLSEDNDFAYYSALSPGLSYFAITGESILLTIPTIPTTPLEQPSVEKPMEEIQPAPQPTVSKEPIIQPLFALTKEKIIALIISIIFVIGLLIRRMSLRGKL